MLDCFHSPDNPADMNATRNQFLITRVAQRSGFISLILLISAVLIPLSGAERKALTNADVIKMVKAELPESTIILAIQSSPNEFDTKPDTLIELKSAGVSSKIIEAMLTARSQPPSGVPAKTDVSATNRDEWPTAYGFYAHVAGKLISLPSVEIQRVFGLGGGIAGGGDAGTAVDGVKDVPDMPTLADPNATFILYDRDARPSPLKLAELRFVSKWSAWNFNVANTPRQFFQKHPRHFPRSTVEINLLRRTDPFELRVEPIQERSDMYRLTPQRPLRAGASYAFYVGDALHESDTVFWCVSKSESAFCDSF